jgi:hypothetical protein
MTSVQRVFVTQAARRDLLSTHYDDVVEIGGGVLGFYEAGEVVVDGFSGRSHGGTRSSCRLDLHYIDRTAAQFRATGRGDFVGTWHTHPNYGRERLLASETDETSWHSWASASSGPFIGVIVARSSPVSSTDDGWASPTIVAYVDRDGRFEELPVVLESEWVRRQSRPEPVSNVRGALKPNGASWQLGPPRWFLGSDKSSGGARPVAATRSADTAAGWMERSKSGPKGTTIRWRERPVPGKPGTVTRVYTDPPLEYGPVINGTSLVSR